MNLLFPTTYDRMPPRKLPICQCEYAVDAVGQVRMRELTGVPPSQKADLKACSCRVHQLLVIITKTAPVTLSKKPRKNRIVAAPPKFEHTAGPYAVNDIVLRRRVRVQCVNLRNSNVRLDQMSMQAEIVLPMCRGYRLATCDHITEPNMYPK